MFPRSLPAVGKASYAIQHAAHSRTVLAVVSRPMMVGGVNQHHLSTSSNLRKCNKVAFQHHARPLSVMSRAKQVLTSNISSPNNNDHQSISAQVASDTTRILHEIIMPLNDQLVGPLDRQADERTPLPFVFLLGNHSAGKSSAINYVLQRRVQETGVAPTDDGFTIIMPGPEDVDQDGPALVGDPDMGFQTLRQFGPNLINHTRLKLRTNIQLKDVMLIDSPGMIDSPTDSISYVGAGKGRKDRGYDFQGVCRWFAERADVILLFFDPDKPGTTGETLSVLTNSLNGLDHKFLIILNKADVFERSSDFARAFGSLTWNLSKVIPRKDLPRIYTTCIPLDTPYTSPNANFTPVAQKPDNNNDAWAAPMRKDLDAVRAEIVDAIKQAPARRVDNMITALHDSTKALQMHAMILEDVRSVYLQAWRTAMLQVAAIGGGGVGFGIGTVSLLGPEVFTFSGSVMLASLLAAFGLSLFNNSKLDALAKTFREEPVLESLFRKRYARELLNNKQDESTVALWGRIRPQVAVAVENLGVDKIPKTSQATFRQLQDVVDVQVPALRRRAAPRRS